MPGSYIIAGARTPIGKMSGALASFSAADLGGFAIAAALQRAGVAPHEVEHVIMGQVLMAGQGQVPSRQAASKAGIPMSVPSININKVCLSGLNSIYLADQMISSGEADIVIAGGGMVGVSLALQLAAVLPPQHSICMVEGYPLPEPLAEGRPQYHPSFDARSTALSYSTRLIYEKMQVWEELQQWLCPIDSIHVSSTLCRRGPPYRCIFQ